MDSNPRTYQGSLEKTGWALNIDCAKSHMQIIEIDWKCKHILYSYPHPSSLQPSVFLGFHSVR